MTDKHSDRKIAAIDLGSNSFHMIVTSIDAHGHMRILDKLRESVRLRGGLDDEKNLSDEVRQRALSCLHRFGERIRDFSSDDVAAVGTNTLRQTRKARRFLDQAEQALGHPVSVISGREEARLIYLGVSHTLAEDDSSNRFVMDIGGGSTELIIGQGFEAKHLESLHMGCVSGSQRFFTDGVIDKNSWTRAITAAKLELMPIQRSYRSIGWDSVTGASGTIKSVRKMIKQCELAPHGITLENMCELQRRMTDAGHYSRFDIPGLSDERKPVIAGGLAILMSTFQTLNIEEMRVSDGALREGLVYDRIERSQSGDLRNKTVLSMQKRFQIDMTHAAGVRETAEELFDACRDEWKLADDLRELLGWAADLHELGLSVSHSSYHKHGAYLLENMDLAGFSSEEQAWLSVLVRTHRRKLNARFFDDLESDRFRSACSVSVLLRMAVLLHRSRGKQALSLEVIEPYKRGLKLTFAGSEKKRPLLFADLEEERAYLKVVNFKLRCDSV
uniref:Exopolyphosphatase n=1 Tax=uncultured Thiotrichaceae bacterium TaxID=298394 RepID=A0A6S6TPH9_9GAMM|nr:MAG: Exopolyphosphatase (EC [uncultured Thiotrichaceae bacterium]